MTLGDGKNLMDWTYVGNVALAHILAFEKLKEEGETTNKVAGMSFASLSRSASYSHIFFPR
jgi:nucleoside-diphosphate-sugar epimerase